MTIAGFETFVVGLAIFWALVCLTDIAQRATEMAKTFGRIEDTLRTIGAHLRAEELRRVESVLDNAVRVTVARKLEEARSEIP